MDYLWLDGEGMDLDLADYIEQEMLLLEPGSDLHKASELYPRPLDPELPELQEVRALLELHAEELHVLAAWIHRGWAREDTLWADDAPVCCDGLGFDRGVAAQVDLVWGSHARDPQT